MNIAFLSGAYKNAGDFLIEQRALNLIRHFLPNVNITRFLRKELAGTCESLNLYDAVVIGGGPIYSRNIERYLPVEEMTQVIQSPIMIVGGGWYGTAGSFQQVYDYTFSRQSKLFLRKVDQEGFGLGCRDIYTYRTLKKEGYQNVWLTGCPAWYNLDTIAQSTLDSDSHKIQSILISDPARVKNFEAAVLVVRYLRERYPDAKITFLFHRGVKEDQFTPTKTAEAAAALKHAINEYCDSVQDISYGEQGFSLYDTCDLHLGFRVHAHIYCLSMRKRSALIEEDGRGAGVNQILGLPSLKVYSDSVQTLNSVYGKVTGKLNLFPYRHLLEDITSYLDILAVTGNVYFENAFRLQQTYFDVMKHFIEQISRNQGGNNCEHTCHNPGTGGIERNPK